MNIIDQELYHEKYIKYKPKHLELQKKYSESCEHNSVIELCGGEKKFDLVEFIKKQKLSIIKKELLDKMNNRRYCDIILGKGFVGEVYVPQINDVVDVITSTNKKIHMHIVVKKSNVEGTINIKMINTKLYIWGYQTIVTEAIILSFFNKLWHQKISPHLPYMVGYSSCGSKNNLFVDKIITERHGLFKNVTVKMEGYDENPIWHPIQYPFGKVKNDLVFSSNLGTLQDLIKFMCLERNDYMIKLPNGQKCNIIEMIDYLCISYIHTHDLLQKNGIILSDMHGANIFIHWLNKNSHLDDTHIGSTESIYYKLGKQFIKIKTFGILLKIGDVGTAIIMPRKYLMILGQAVDLEKNLGVVKQMIKPNYLVFWFIHDLKNMLPVNIYEKSIAYQIMSSYPYNEIVDRIPIDYSLLNDMLLPEQLLKYFDKYFVSKINKEEKYLVY